MKRTNIIIALLLVTCISLTGCGTSTANRPVVTEQDTVVQNTETTELETSMSDSATEQDTEIAQSESGTSNYDMKESESEETASPEQSETTMEDTKKMQTTTYNLNGVDFTMVYVEAGTFTMGSDDTNVAYSESPAHKVTLTKDYLMGETEVTEALWLAVMGNGGGSNSMPETSVTWSDAHDFVDKLNQITHEQRLIAETENFILPTEAQWEYAARGGNLSKGYRYSGSDNIDDVAQTLENTGSNSPVAVKGKQPNELGLYDMSGNAYEWVNDYAGNYSAEDQIDPQNTISSRSYVKRGGSNYHRFSSEPYLFTTTGRYFYGSTDWTIGFRIALEQIN